MIYGNVYIHMYIYISTITISYKIRYKYIIDYVYILRLMPQPFTNLCRMSVYRLLYMYVSVEFCRDYFYFLYLNVLTWLDLNFLPVVSTL